MNSKPIRIPGPDHPITIARRREHITVSVAGQRIADTREALTLREAAYPPVHYIPRKDVDTSQLERTSHQTYCPYKGNCGYFYEAPYTAVSEIREYLALYPDRVDTIQIKE